MTYPLEVAVEFNRNINEQDIEKLSDMSAKIEDHKVSEWRVYSDDRDIRERLGIPEEL